MIQEMSVDNVISLSKGENLQYQGSYIVKEGFLACKILEQLVYFVQQGDAIVTQFDSRSLLQFQAKTATNLIKVAEARDYVILRQQEVVKERVLQALIAHAQILSMPAKQRLYVVLYQLGKEMGTKIGTERHIPAIMTQMEMASYINCTREYLCLIKKQLIEDGWLKKERGWALLDWMRWELKFSKVLGCV
ncbi:helix-turn-helix domain-containing protein [Listeria rocourtiae]|uniref:Crp/Fnr family transcriptional regulator n=1 Tax=Listeria rocourtiae TaxID=647910 RepID=UPI003D2F66E5